MSSVAVPRQAARARGGRFRLGPLVVVGLPLALGVVVALPLILLLVNSFNLAAPGQAAVYGLTNWTRSLGDAATLSALWNSFVLAAVRTLISLPVAVAIVWLLARSDMPGRGLFEMLCWLAIFLPTLPLTFGWILLLEPNFGLVNTLIDQSFGEGKPFNIYSFWGITWVHLASSAIYYKIVLLLPAFRRVGAVLEEAARMCGANQWQATLRISIPLLAPAIAGIAILSFVRSLEVFEVELLLGKPANIQVYSTRIYDLVRDSPPAYGQATALGFVFLVALLGLALLQQWYLRGKSYATVTGRGFSSSPVKLGKWRWVACAFCFGFMFIALAAPLFFLVLGSFTRRYGFFQIANPYTLQHWQNLFGDPIFVSSVRNTLIIATLTAVLVVTLYSTVAYAIVRGNSRWLRVTDSLLWLPWAVPGVLLSLGMLWLTLGTPLRSILYGSVLNIALALALKDSPVATQFFKASFMQVGRELEESARVCGANWIVTYVRMLLPLVASTAVTVGMLSFMSAIRDISIPVLLYSANSRPLSILMLEYSFSGEMERGAAIGVLVAGFVLVVTLVVRAIGLRAAGERV
jgi:iron(III) transport system permease protein